MARTLLRPPIVLDADQPALTSPVCCLSGTARTYELETTLTGSHVRWHLRVERGAASRRDVLDALTMPAASWSAIPGVPSIRSAALPRTIDPQR